MKLKDTYIDQGGLMRCCLETIYELDPEKDWPNKIVIDCKHEKPGNKSIRLVDGVWQWNA
jgi:hypothetical protein